PSPSAAPVTSAPLRHCAYALTPKSTTPPQHAALPISGFSISIDHTAPNAPVITGFADNSGSTGDSLTNDTTPTLTITAEAGSSGSVLQAAVSEGLATQIWPPVTFTFTSGALGDGSYSF